jgi:hypothetical protein
MPQLVDPFDLTLLLPMGLAAAGSAASRDKWYARFDAALSGTGWMKADPLARGAPEAKSGHVYAEMAYFHPHVRRFLYGEKYPEPGEHPNRSAQSVHAYGNARLNEFRLEIEREARRNQFELQDVFLHHIQPDGVFLSMRLVAKGPIPWQDALDAISLLRTVAFQHYKNDAKEGEPAAWMGADAKYLDRMRFTGNSIDQPVRNRFDEMKRAIEHRRPEAIALWAELLTPLRQALAKEGLRLELLGDHRMAVMVFAGVANPTWISDDEWFALVQADAAGYATYAPAFREMELRKACYDRWWDGAGPGNQLKHRYMAGPLTFLSIMRWPPEPRDDYFDRMRTTWRRQQFQIFLLAHYQRAALLMLEARIAALAEKIPTQEGANQKEKKDTRDLLEDIEQLEGDVAKFSSGRWFPEVSPQIQGQELYELLRRHLRLDALYENVSQDKALLANWVAAVESRRRARVDERINKVYLPAVLAVTILGAGIVTEPLKELLADHLSAIPGKSLVAGVIAAALTAFTMWMIWLFTRRALLAVSAFMGDRKEKDK